MNKRATIASIPTTDRRRAHGAQTRQEILAAAVRVAASEGLESLTIGRLAGEVGMSKAGLFGHFGSKEALQIATIDTAWEAYRQEVVGLIEAVAPGAPQLRAFMEHYIRYVLDHVDQGGCFFTAVSAEFDDREGAVRSRVQHVIAERNQLIETVLRAAVRVGHLPADTDISQMSFEVLSLVTGAYLMFQLTKEPETFQRLRYALRRLAPPLREHPNRHLQPSRQDSI